jgi:Na+-transporting methylmalonyl-CoA/oxaloacetate decarboxylase gamma subunit
MYLVAIAWMYVVLMMAVAEAFSPQGTVLGALVTLVFYGLLPLSIVMYLMGTPRRRAARRRAEADDAAQAARATKADQADEAATAARAPASPQPDDGGHAAAAQPIDTFVAERKES